MSAELNTTKLDSEVATPNNEAPIDNACLTNLVNDEPDSSQVIDVVVPWKRIGIALVVTMLCLAGLISLGPSKPSGPSKEPPAQATSRPQHSLAKVTATSSSTTAQTIGSTTLGSEATDTQTSQPATLPLENFPGSALFNSQPPFLAGVLVDRIDQKYREGDKLTVRFQAEQDAHLYLLYHQADGSSVLLFPNEAQRDNRIPAKTLVSIPPNDDAFRFRVSAPFGTEVLQVIASTKPIADLDGLIQNQKRAPAVSVDLMTKLVAQLQQDFSSWSEHRVQIVTTSKDGTIPQPPSNRIGLFVGIGQSQNSPATAHPEFARSAETLHDAMLKEAKLDRTRTRLILDDQATKIILEEAFVRWLPSVSRPGDTVFVYFSGHVTQVAAAQADEPDGQDEALVPYDAPAGLEALSVDARVERIRKTHLLDDAVARWLQELTGCQVVMILDTCHRGGSESNQSVALGFLSDESARVRDISRGNMVLLASSLVDEPKLFEGTPNKTLWMTHSLTESLSNRDRAKPLTIRSAFDESRNRLQQLLPDTHPARKQEPLLVDPSQPAAVFAP